MVEDRKKQAEEQKKQEAEKAKAEHEAEMERRRTDTNYNPLLQNGVTNKDIFRTLVFHFREDNFVPVSGVANFVQSLLKRPCNTQYDEDAEKRFHASLIKNLEQYAKKDGKIYEKEFCELMRTFETQNESEFTDEQQYDMFLDRLFYRAKHAKVESIEISDFRNLVERSGFKFTEAEFGNLIKWYFKGKETITLEDFKMFATGQLQKVVEKPKK